MPKFDGKLTQNKINKLLFNMIISQRVFDSKVADTELADFFRVDGTMYGDTKTYSSFDIDHPESWLDDEEAANLLKINRNKSAETQSIKMGVYQMVSITTDAYLSKQAFMKEGTFSEYIGFLTGSLRKMKRVYDRALINSTIGTLEPGTTSCKVTITTPKGQTIEETNRLRAQHIASELRKLGANMKDNTRKYNEYNFLRSYDIKDFVAVWNVDVLSEILKIDLPTMYHKDIGFDGSLKKFELTSKWFGNKATVDLELPNAAPAEPVNYILKSGWYDVSGEEVTLVNKPSATAVYFWAGDEVPYTGEEIKDYSRGISVTVVSTKLSSDYYYIKDSTIAFMLVHKEALPFMSGFETGTQFWNARSLTNNNYLIWGHNELEFLKEYPRFKVNVVAAEA